MSTNATRALVRFAVAAVLMWWSNTGDMDRPSVVAVAAIAGMAVTTGVQHFRAELADYRDRIGDVS